MKSELGIKKYFVRREAYTTIRRLFDFDNSSDLLKKSEKIQIINKNHIRLRRNELKGNDIGIMIFE